MFKLAGPPSVFKRYVQEAAAQVCETGARILTNPVCAKMVGIFPVLRRAKMSLRTHAASLRGNKAASGVALYGYRADTVPIPIKLAKPHIRIEESGRKQREPARRRKYVATDLGPHIVGAAPTIPDIAADVNVLDAIYNRIFKRPHKSSRALLAELKAFITDVYLPEFGKAEFNWDTSFESFIKQWEQPAARKAVLTALFEEFCATYQYDPTVKAFIKFEAYPEYKHPRGIYSRSDSYKAVFGPLYSILDKFVFSHPDFIKHVPVADRAAYLDNLFGEAVGDGNLFKSDYTAYECSYVWELFDAVLLPLVDYVLSSVFGFPDLVSTIKRDIMGINRINFRGFMVYILCTLMSGEFITSALNSFCNAACIRFVAHRSGATLGPLKVEGDDSIFWVIAGKMSIKIWQGLGLTVKLEGCTSIGDAGFLSMHWVKPDEMFRDPRKTILKFGWMDARYHGMKSNLRRRFLRCKALSIACETPRAPVVWALASRFIELTKGVVIGNLLDSNAFDSYERQRLKLMLGNWRTPAPPSIETRVLCEELFGLSVNEQLDMEREIMALPDTDTPLHFRVWDPHPDNVKMYFNCICIKPTEEQTD